MKLIVCGGRNYRNIHAVRHVLTAVHAKRPITLLIEGGAKGADRLAREWAVATGVPVATEEADWDKYGKRAGPIRNSLMLSKYMPDGIIAFPGGFGTDDMIAQALKAGVKVYEPF